MAFGDFTVTRASTKNVLGSNGLYQSVANNVPAFEFNTDGSYRGLLVEPGATNLNPYSQQFDNAEWEKVNTTVTPNAVVAPDGTTTADNLFETTDNGTHWIYDNGIPCTSGTAYTCSLFVKPNGRDWISILFFAGGGVFNGNRAWFNVSTGTVGIVQTGITASIEDYGDGWYRISATQTAAATANGFIIYGTATADGEFTFVGDAGLGLSIWQGQTETGSVATSPIVTTGSTASRVADVVSLTGASSLIGQQEGTIYIEHQPILSTGTVSRTVINISDNSASNQVLLQYQSYGSPSRYRLVSRVSNGGVNTLDLAEGNAGGLTTGNVEKLAIGYKNADYATYRNGVAVVGTNTGTGTLTSIASSEIDLGNLFNNTLTLNGWIRSVALFPTRLPNATLVSLTTP
jgi:hypothetical protein